MLGRFNFLHYNVDRFETRLHLLVHLVNNATSEATIGVERDLSTTQLRLLEVLVRHLLALRRVTRGPTLVRCHTRLLDLQHNFRRVFLT